MDNLPSNEPFADNEKKMTVKEVAEALGCDGETVRRHVKGMWPSLFQNGKTTYLNQAQVTAVKISLERSGRNDLRNVAELPSTDLEMMMLDKRVSEWKTRKIEELKKENDILRIDNKKQAQLLIEQTPKVEFFDAVANSKDAIPMRNAAAVLNMPGWGRNKLFARLRVLDVLDSNNIPYRPFQDKGYFRVIERIWSDPAGDRHITFTTLVYQKGLDYIRKLISKSS